MDSGLLFAAFMLGAAGGPHCAVMCAAAQHGIVRSCSAAAPGPAVLALQVGRLIGYSAAGGLLAGGVSLLGAARAASPLFAALWTMAQVAAVVLGILLLCTGRQPAFLGGAARPVAAGAAQVRFVPRLPRAARAGMAGVVWTLVPCGLLHSALVIAALASGPVQGATVMAAFAAASALSLWLAPQLWTWLQLRESSERWTRLAVRVAGLLLCAASLFALANRLGTAAGASWCLT
jgi:sulfite exporter TauE/SafE